MLQQLIGLLKNKQTQNLSIYGFGQLFNLVTPLLVVPYIVSICGEENFGKTAVGMAFSFFLMVFIDYSSDLIGVRDIAINRSNIPKLEKLFTITYSAKFVLLSIVLAVAITMFYCIPYFKSERSLFILGLSVLIGQFLNPTWFLQGIENIKWITFSNVISKIIYLSGIFLFIKSESDYIFINLLWGIGMIIVHFTTFLLIIKKYKFSFKAITKSDIKIFLQKDFKMFTSQIFVSIQMYSPVILISFFGSNLMAGQYKIVEQIILVFKTYILLFFNFVYPKVCYQIEINKTRGLFIWKALNGVNLILVICSMLFIYLFSYDVVSYFNPTNRYVLSSLLEIAVFFPVLFAISIPLKQLVLGLNHQRFYINTTTITVVFNLLAIVLLIPSYKVYGVFYSLIITEGIVILFYLLCIKKDLFSK